MLKGRRLKSAYDLALASTLHRRAHGQANAQLQVAEVSGRTGHRFWLKTAYGLGAVATAAASAAFIVNEGELSK